MSNISRNPLSLGSIVTHRLGVDSPRFRAESSFGRSTGEIEEKKCLSDKVERDIAQDDGVDECYRSRLNLRVDYLTSSQCTLEL